MVESRSLQLAAAAGNLRDAMAQHVAASLAEQGFTDATPAALQFLSVLECGVNHASDIARSLSVSRQMVAKTVRTLCEAGYLEQMDGAGKQKAILFTERGEQLIAAARQTLAEFDERIGSVIETRQLDELLQQLSTIQRLTGG